MSYLSDLYRHNLWANLRLIDACERLPQGALDVTAPGTYGRIPDTLVHIIANEGGYAMTLRGASGTAFPGAPGYGDSFSGWAPIRDAARRTGEALIELAEGTPPGHILRGEFQGRPFEMTAGIPLIQAINHGTEHRAHITTLMTMAGAQPPALDAWAYGSDVNPG